MRRKRQGKVDYGVSITLLNGILGQYTIGSITPDSIHIDAVVFTVVTDTILGETVVIVARFTEDGESFVAMVVNYQLLRQAFQSTGR